MIYFFPRRKIHKRRKCSREYFSARQIAAKRSCERTRGSAEQTATINEENGFRAQLFAGKIFAH